MDEKKILLNQMLTYYSNLLSFYKEDYEIAKKYRHYSYKNNLSGRIDMLNMIIEDIIFELSVDNL